MIVNLIILSREGRCMFKYLRNRKIDNLKRCVVILQKHEKFYYMQNITTIKVNVDKQSTYLRFPSNFIPQLKKTRKAYVKILEETPYCHDLHTFHLYFCVSL